MHLDLLLRVEEDSLVYVLTLRAHEDGGINYSPSAVGVCVEMTITIVSQKRVHGWSTLKSAKEGGA